MDSELEKGYAGVAAGRTKAAGAEQADADLRGIFEYIAFETLQMEADMTYPLNDDGIHQPNYFSVESQKKKATTGNVAPATGTRYKS